MTTLTLARSCVDARPGRDGALFEPDAVLTPPAQPSIRGAGLADIPAIARIAVEGPEPVGVEPAAMSRATRLLLAHVAFEHGALWVEQVDGGRIARAVTAIPAGQMQPSVLSDVIGQVGRLASPPPVPVFGFARSSSLR